MCGDCSNMARLILAARNTVYYLSTMSERRYRKYLFDASADVPKSTAWRDKIGKPILYMYNIQCKS